MVLSAIVKALKAVVDAVAKVIAWLLLALGLWVPLLYSLIFVIVVVLFTDVPLATTGTIYFFGLFVSFVGALWFSMIRGAQKAKRKRAKKAGGYNISEVQRRAEEAPIANEEQPPTIKNESNARISRIEDSSSYAQNYIQDMPQNRPYNAPYERIEPQSQYSECATYSGPQNQPYDRPSGNQWGDRRQPTGWGDRANIDTREPQSQWEQKPQNRPYNAPYESIEPQSQYSERATYNEPQNQPYDRPSGNQWGDRRQPTGWGDRANIDTREPQSQWEQKPQNQWNEQQINPWTDRAMHEPQSQPYDRPNENLWKERPAYNEPQSQPYDKPSDNQWSDRRQPTGWGDRANIDAREPQSQWEQKPQNQWNEPQNTQWQNNVPDRMDRDSMPRYDRMVADETPRIFRLREDPNVLVYEYSDRLDYYRRTAQGRDEFLRRKYK